ncbi:MAG: APC family permease [Planctomycetota bacterium]|jgi:amino acid transporter
MSIVPKKELSLFDSTCIIVGIIIGAGVYETAPAIAASMGGSAATICIWIVGGLLALAGAFCYGELATTYPHEGGDFVYLNRAYGGWAGYMFGWSQVAIIRPGDIALMVFVFARYASRLYPFEHSNIIYAVSAVIILTAVNIAGVKQGKWTQNLLTVAKAAGLLAIVVAGFLAPPQTKAAQTGAFTMGGLKLALILVMFTYAGWHEMGYVAAEVRQPHRNIVRAMVLGTAAVTILYLLINAAFFHALGYKGVAVSEAVAVDTVSTALPLIAGKAISVLICISTLGATNGLIFTGARISYALGTKHSLFGQLGKWSARFGTPVFALCLQGALSSLIVILAGSFIDTLLYYAPVFWMFFLLTALSVFVLRRKDSQVSRPYRVTGYPVTPIIFCCSCAFMIYNCVSYALANRPKGLLIVSCIVLAGAMLYWVGDVRKQQKV